MSRSAGSRAAAIEVPNVSSKTIHAVGHGNRALAEFIDLRRAADMDTLVDIRAQPHSRRYPHFSRERLQASLEHARIDYHWMGHRLGGRRTSSANSAHIALADNERGFADHMRSDAFESAVNELLTLRGQPQTVMMCAEKQPARCHRSLIADYLTYMGVKVLHLVELDERREHQLHPAARKTAEGLIHDRYATRELGL